MPNLLHTGIVDEFIFRSSRSSGPGGQHVNKTETRVQLFFDVLHSRVLNSEQKEIIMKKLRGRINKEGILRITASSGRSQAVNKQHAIKRFFELIESALIKEKQRIPTQPGREQKKQRLKSKREQSEKKQRRRYLPDPDD